MAMMPKRVKYRKSMRRARDRKATSGNFVAFGEYGLQTLEGGWLPARVLEAGRIAATHFLRREGKIYIRRFADKPVSKKPLETRMGKGKAETDYWAAVVKPGHVIFEIGGVPELMAKQALARMAQKMPFRCRMVHRRHTV
ncbi:MAG: 50S ribosomal protein L16 [Phycisphaerae bacterium]|nr:50S ribosomal protein L16 [Phycisphaerae bacterium]